MTQTSDHATISLDETVFDVTRPRPARRCRVDGDVFTLKPALSARSMLRAVALNDRAAEAEDNDEKLQAVAELVDLVMEPASAELFNRRLGDDDNPIEIVQVNMLMPWFLSSGEVPTLPSDSLSTGSDDRAPGTSSTATAPAEA